LSVADAVALLAALLLGLTAGALLTEGAVLITSWRSSSPSDFLDWYRQNAKLLVNFYGPLEIFAAALAIAAAVLVSATDGSGLGLLMLAAALAFTVLAMFPLYFRATNASFVAGTIELQRVADELRRYARWHWVRTALGIAAFATAILAVRSN
jgi:hypothetical protein